MPFQWSSMILCRYPRDKDEVKYKEFVMKVQNGGVKEKEEFENLEKEIFYKDPKDILLKMAVGKSIPELFMNPTKYEYPLQAPFVKVFLGDYMYLGFCLEVSLEDIRQEWIQKGILDKKKIDISFDAAFWLRVSQHC